jgi:AraC-like DNA-binding protein
MKALVQPIFTSPQFKIFDFRCLEEPESKSNVEPARHHEITFTRTGDFEIHHGKQSCAVHNQVLLLTNPGNDLIFRHRARVRDTCTTFRVSPSLLVDVSGRDPDFPHSTILTTPAMDYIHAQLYETAVQPYLSGNRLKTEDLLLTLLRHIYREFYREHSNVEVSMRLLDQHLETIERAKHYMLANFDQEMSLRDISRAALVSEYHFSRIFRAFTRRSPYGYLIQIRLNHAARLLKDTSRSVTEICYDSGFNNFPHFVSSFTRQFGLSPSRYRM